MTQLIIFDCDGTLVDSEPLHLKATFESLKDLGKDPDKVAHFVGTGLSMENLQKEFEAVYGESLTDHFIPLVNKKYIEFLTEIEPAKGVEIALNNLMHVHKCVASNGELPNVQKSITGAGIAQHFNIEHVFSAQMVERAKPAPDLFLHALSAFNVAPEDAVVLEDTKTGVLAAKAAGIPVIGFAGASHSDSDEYVQMLRDAGADIVIRDMAELPSIIQG